MEEEMGLRLTRNRRGGTDEQVEDDRRGERKGDGSGGGPEEEDRWKGKTKTHLPQWQIYR